MLICEIRVCFNAKFLSFFAKFSKFNEVDFIATPTSTDLPYELGTRVEDPLADYDDGTFDVPVNLVGLCAISLPIREGISGALQIIGNRRDDEKVLNAAYCFEGGR